MKIMFIIPRMNGGGAERVVANLCNYMCKENEVRIVAVVSDESYYKLDKRVEFCSESISINRKNMFNTLICYCRYFFSAMRFIKNNISDFGPDCVISFLTEADILTYLATKKRKNIIKVYSERNDPTQLSRLKLLLLKKIYKRADLFVCQSKKIYDYYFSVPKNKKVIIPNPIDESILPNPVLEEENRTIVSVGRLHKQKNQILLINSYIMAIKELPEDCNLTIYGDGPLKVKLQRIIDGSGYADRIRLAGASKGVLEEIKGCALFVLSSDYEGFPNALLEAMAIGLPVISTNFFSGTAAEIIKEENGILVPVGDEKKMAEAIIEIMSDKKRRTKFRRNNVLVRDEYNMAVINSLWMNCIIEAKRRRINE